MGNLTIVTCLYDLGRDKLSGGFSRGFDHYLDSFKKLLAVDVNLVVFCDSTVKSFCEKYRSNSNTRYVVKSLDKFLDNFPFLNQVEKIRKDPKWFKQAAWLEESPQAKLAGYNPLVMSKMFMMNDARIYNFFNTDYFVWLDAGIANTCHIPSIIPDVKEFESRIASKLFSGKMQFVCFPYDGQSEVHGFAKSEMNNIAGTDTTYVARGGFFGGSGEVIETVSSLYYALLQSTLNKGFMGTEESIFTLLTYQHPDLVALDYIEINGLLYKFFEDLKKIPVEKQSEFELAFYVLTYNLPQQLKLWCEHFKNNFKYKAKLYLINNSDDKSTFAEYQSLITEYGFEEIYFTGDSGNRINVGINDGRYEAATHFDSSDHKYMVFFEDDMLINSETEFGHCKSGFPKGLKNWPQTAMRIMEREGLDYLKLSFSEFYGDNFLNWGWHNVPEKIKSQVSKNAKVEKLVSLKGVPYSVGQHHYCNWPILFTKAGNKKVFLDRPVAHKFEQTYMSMVCQRQLNNEIRAGCLLASLITHDRKYHYKKGTRKENKHS